MPRDSQDEALIQMSSSSPGKGVVSYTSSDSRGSTPCPPVLVRRPFFIRSFLHFLVPLLLLVVGVFAWNEWAIYYVKIASSCEWPDAEKGDRLRVMMIADTHLLGKVRGHWFDKLRREWQMRRSYRTAQALLQPQAAFFLGDIFDEGQIANEEVLEEYARRFEELFGQPRPWKEADNDDHVEQTRIFVLPGNHDLGFHYAMNPYTVEWFQRRFAHELIDVAWIGKRPFVLVTSMALHGDGCRLCSEAERELARMRRRRECSLDDKCAPVEKKPWPKGALSPVILQHFPLYRLDERPCRDVPVSDPGRLAEYRPKWEALSESSTSLVLSSLRPIAAFDGHSHKGCTRRWNSTETGGRPFTEYTVNSFSWRNGRVPSLLLVSLPTGDDSEEPSVSTCFLPNEDVVVCVYCMSLVALLAYLAATFWAFVDWKSRQLQAKSRQELSSPMHTCFGL